MPSRVSLPCRRRPPVPSREPDLANFARASMPVALETFHPCIPWRSVEGRRRLPGMNSHRAHRFASDGRGGEFFSLESSAGGGGREGRDPRFSPERSSGSGRTEEVVFPGVLGREAEAGRKSFSRNFRQGVGSRESLFSRSAKTPGRRTVRAFETAEMRRPVPRRPAIRRVRRARRPRASFQWRSSTAG